MKALLYGCSVLVCSGSAAAQLVVPVAQSRTVRATSQLLGPPDQTETVEDIATGLAPFDAAESVTLDNSLALASAGGEQVSELLDTSVAASGGIFVNGESYDQDWAARALSVSELFYDFELTAKASFTITGVIAAFDHADAVVALQGPTGQVAAVHTLAGPGVYPVELSGVLDPGMYRYLVIAEGSAFGENLQFDFGFAEYDVNLQLTPLSSNYCVAAPNSAGPGATLALGGSQNLADNDFRVEAAGAIPNGFGLVYYGPNQIQAPFGDGFRCVGGQTHRVQPPIQADSNGFVSKPISFTSGPAASGSGQITADSTWNFQLWYRDAAGPGGTGYNVSDGLSVTFCQ